MREQPKGTIISFNRIGERFNIVDANSKTVSYLQYSLSDGKTELKQALEAGSSSPRREDSSALQELLTSFGVGGID
jgi:hypothetical protein